MKRVALTASLGLFALTACGVDGAPERPATATGLTISGSAQIGIARNGG